MMTRRPLARFGAGAVAGTMASAMGRTAVAQEKSLESPQGFEGAAPPASSPRTLEEQPQLRSEFLVDLLFERGTANNVGGVGLNRIVVPVSGGTFEGPRLGGTIVAPSGDWLSARPDGSSVLDLRLVLQTDDGAKIYVASRGVAYTQAGGALWARIQPTFETSAPKYLWLNNVVAVGVFRSVPGKVAYRVFNIL